MAQAAANVPETELVEPAINDVPINLPDNSLLLADRGYDSDPLRDTLADQGFNLLSPHRKNRTKQWQINAPI